MSGDVTVRKPRGGRPTKAMADEMWPGIVKIASELCARQGYAATSVEQVVAACGIGKDTIYRRFPSKAALFESVVDQARQRTVAHLDQALDVKGEPLHRLKIVARWFLQVNLDPELTALRRIAFSEAIVLTGITAPKGPDPLLTRLADLIRAAQDAGQIEASDADFLAQYLINAVVAGPSTEAMLGGTAYKDQTQQDEYFAAAWALFMNGAAKHI